jgi:hypothetical protein
MSAEAKRRSREKVRNYRQRKKAEGFRLIQRWVPDTRTPEFAARVRREVQAIVKSEHAADDQAFIDSISELKFE